MIAFWLPLWSMIDVNNGLVFLLFVFVFFLTISIIVRMRDSSRMSSVTSVSFNRRPAAAQQMSMVRNPFHVELSTSTESIVGFQSPLSLEVLCDNSYTVHAFWGVGINEFHKWMAKTSVEFAEALQDGTLFDQKYLHKCQVQSVVDEPRKSITIQTSDLVSSITLGDSPRSVYPLVAILKLNTDIITCGPDDTIFAVNVIHVKDEVCPMPTGIISKLLKQSNGATIAIQNLFVPEADDPSVEQWTQCVICQERSVSIALLPCRHACICFDCFIQIDKCPLCRSYISTYFVLKPAQAQSDLANQSQSSTVDSPQSQSSTESPRRGLLARVNHQFNRLFSL